MSDAARSEEPGRPVLRVVRGDATPEEVAAVLAVVLAAARARAAAAGMQDQPASVWGQRFALRSVRAASGLEPGANGWRTSFWDR